MEVSARKRLLERRTDGDNRYTLSRRKNLLRLDGSDSKSDCYV